MSSLLLIISLALVGAYTRADDAGPYPAYWPNPTQLEFGKTPVTLSSTFSFELTGSAAASPILTRGATRYEGLILQGVDTHEEAVAESTLVSCTVAISSTDDPQNEAATLKLGVDESYSLDVTLEPVLACTINAETVWGALHAFETFSQSLVRQQAPSSSSDTIQVAVGAGGGRAEEAVETVAVLPWAPLSVADGARFTHRGLLVDTSRHFLPLAHLQHVVDSLSYSKLNVLHWHTVRGQLVNTCPLLLKEGGKAA
jgi:hexosaminidase